jgi:hypothetical protein
MDQFAADLAADVRASNSMPDDLRRQFIPKDDAATKRANMTSQQWVGALLHPENDQFVGVIVLCVSAPTSEAKPPVFVLIKGKKIEDDQFRITQLVFGDARQALN